DSTALAEGHMGGSAQLTFSVSCAAENGGGDALPLIARIHRLFAPPTTRGSMDPFWVFLSKSPEIVFCSFSGATVSGCQSGSPLPTSPQYSQRTPVTRAFAPDTSI